MSSRQEQPPRQQAQRHRQEPERQQARREPARPQPARPQPARPRPARPQPARPQPERPQPERPQPAPIPYPDAYRIRPSRTVASSSRYDDEEKNSRNIRIPHYSTARTPIPYPDADRIRPSYSAAPSASPTVRSPNPSSVAPQQSYAPNGVGQHNGMDGIRPPPLPNRQDPHRSFETTNGLGIPVLRRPTSRNGPNQRNNHGPNHGNNHGPNNPPSP